ncbi:MAG: arylsulfatase [Tepidisphaerales bacterium]
MNHSTTLLGGLTVLLASLAGYAQAQPRPNIIVILSDDMGFSDLGCFGGEINTPNLDRLAGNGVRFTQFYNTARCCPTRASLLSGLYPHQAGVGHMVDPGPRPAYAGDLSRDCVTIPEVLRPAGYRTYAVGKWHVAQNVKPDGPRHNWPLQRGFDRYYGTLAGAGSYFDPSALMRDNTPITYLNDRDYPSDAYYYTDAITAHAERFITDHRQQNSDKPFFMYVAYTAAHWPLHAPEDQVARYKGKYDAGYDAIRRARYEKALRLGIVTSGAPFTPTVGDWDKVQNKAWEARCMEVYAAIVDRMDQGIGRIVSALDRTGQLDNTLLLFLQDNGACAEPMGRGNDEQRADHPTLKPVPADQIVIGSRPPQTRDGWPMLGGRAVLPGPRDTFISYGREWANVSNTPFREYKHWVHEGGIATPLIAHWPAGIPAERRNQLERQPGHLIDIMAACIDLAGAKYPAEVEGRKIPSPEGVSLRPALLGQDLHRSAPLFFEHEGNRAIRDGQWKLVAKGPAGKWELYDMSVDRSETHDLAGEQPERVKQLTAAWEAWATRTKAIPWPHKPQYGQPTQVAADKKTFDLRQGDDLSGEEAPQVAHRGITITVAVAQWSDAGVLLAQGGATAGYTLYVRDGKLVFGVREARRLTTISGDVPPKDKAATVTARLETGGVMILSVDGRELARGRAAGLLGRQPADGLQVGRDDNGAVGDYQSPFTFRGTITKATVELADR